MFRLMTGHNNWVWIIPRKILNHSQYLILICIIQRRSWFIKDENITPGCKCTCNKNELPFTTTKMWIYLMFQMRNSYTAKSIISNQIIFIGWWPEHSQVSSSSHQNHGLNSILKRHVMTLRNIGNFTREDIFIIFTGIFTVYQDCIKNSKYLKKSKKDGNQNDDTHYQHNHSYN